MTNENQTAGKKQRKLGLTSVILIALALGIVCGVIFHYIIPAGTVRDDIFVNGIFYVVGQGFIRLMQMLVVPLVFCSIVCGAASIGDTKTLGTIGVKTLIFYLCTTALAITVALCMGNLLNPGLGVDMSSILVSDTSSLDKAQSNNQTVADTLLSIIPKNPINALASGDMLAVIFFALFVGIIISIMGRKVETVHRFFEQFNDIMMKMTSIVMYVAPIGVFCLLSRTFANVGFEAFMPMVPRRLHDHAVAARAREPHHVPEEVLPRYGVRVLDRDVECDHSSEHGNARAQNGRRSPHFLVHHSSGRDHQYGWHVYHAGRCRRVHRAVVRRAAGPC